MADIQKQIDANVSSIEGRSIGGGKLDNRSAGGTILRALSEGQNPTTAADWLKLGYRPMGRGGLDSEELSLLNRAMDKSRGLAEQVKAAKETLHAQTRKDTHKLKSLFDTRKGLTDESVEQNTLDSLRQANQFKYINTEINKAFVKDLEGPLVEGGILGMFNNPNTALRKAMDNIEAKYGTAMANAVYEALKNINKQAELAQAIINQDTSQGAKIGQALGAYLGYRRGSKIEEYYRTSADFRGYMKKNLIKNLLGGGLSLVSFAATGTLYGGMMKTPFKIQSVPTPTKDIVAKALYGDGTTSKNIIQGSIDELDSYITRTMRSGKFNSEKAAGIQTEVGEGLRIDGSRLEHDLNQSENSFRNFIDKIPLIGLITDDERPLKRKIEELGVLTQKLDKTPAELARAYQLHVEISNKLNARKAKEQSRGTNNGDVALQTLRDVVNETRQSASVEALRRNNPFKAFLDQNRDRMNDIVPTDPETQAAINAYYEGKSYAGRTGENLVSYIWNSAETGGAQAMYRAYAQGGPEARLQYKKQHRPGLPQTNAVPERSDSWGGNISKILNNPSAVKDYIATHKNKENGMNLADGYEKKLSDVTDGMLEVDASAIIKAIGGGTLNESFSGQNTGINTKNLNETVWKGRVLECRVPARFDGMQGYLTFGIKGDCANLVISSFESEYNPNNPSANIMLRFPLLYTPKKSGESSPKKKGNESNPKGEKGGGGKSNERIGSTPKGKTGEDPGGLGNDANKTEIHLQRSDKNTVQPGPLTPGKDGTPPVDPKVPVNPDKTW